VGGGSKERATINSATKSASSAFILSLSLSLFYVRREWTGSPLALLFFPPLSLSPASPFSFSLSPFFQKDACACARVARGSSIAASVP